MTLQVKDLQSVLSATATETDRFYKKFINFSSWSKSIESCVATVNSIQSLIKDLTGAYNAQAEVETQLAVAMRNTMGSR